MAPSLSHPETVASPNTLADSPSPTCFSLEGGQYGSLDLSLSLSCSSHGFSSLQSPSAFPSFLTEDSLIGESESLSLDCTERCHCHLHHGRDACEFLLDTTQNFEVSQRRFVIRDCEALEDKSLCEASRKETLIQKCEPLQEKLNFEALQREIQIQDSDRAKSTISRVQGQIKPLLLSASLDLASSAQNPAFLPRSHNHGGDSHSSSHGSHSQGRGKCRIDPHERRSQSHKNCSTDTRESHSHNSYYILPLQTSSSVLPSSRQNASAFTEYEEADGKENIVEEHHMDGSRGSKPLKKAAWQGLQGLQETVNPTFEEQVINPNPNPNLKASGGNLYPKLSGKARKRVGGVTADISGWMCPRDGKRNFKPKPKQILLDKWLAKQR